MDEKYFDFLMQSEAFRDIPEKTLRHLDPPPKCLIFSRGEIIIHEGDLSNSVYLLVKGRLRIFRHESDGNRKRINDIAPGTFLGEMSLLTEEPALATVQVMRQATVIQIAKKAYFSLIKSSQPFTHQVVQTVVGYYRSHLHQKSSQSYRYIALYNLDPAIDGHNFMQTLKRAIAPKRCGTLTADQRPQTFKTTKNLGPTTAIHFLEHGQWLRSLEENNDVTLFLTDGKEEIWHQFVMHHADMVLLLTKDNSPQEGIDLCEEDATKDHLDLMPRFDLLHFHNGHHIKPGELKKWRQKIPFPLQRAHHINPKNSHDIARLARVVTGEENGLVLGGGGARGLAHMGVLKALEENHIPIDFICGTSMGSFIAAQWAIGMSVEEMIQTNREIWINARPTREYTLPLLSFLRGKRLHDAYKRCFKGWQIEDLPIGFFCISANISRNKMEIHDQGPLWKWVRASCSIPAMGPPLFHEGEIFVDGGILNNLPADILAQRMRGKMILVDVSPPETITVPESFNEEVPSGWKLLWKKLNPSYRNDIRALPSLFDMIYRSVILNSDRLAQKVYDLADLLIKPPVEKYAILDFKELDELVEVGYQETIKSLSNSSFVSHSKD
ncbi:patatin-like phospholipase family protein [Magnetococcales bacterium HHB-1]